MHEEQLEFSASEIAPHVAPVPVQRSWWQRLTSGKRLWLILGLAAFLLLLIGLVAAAALSHTNQPHQAMAMPTASPSPSPSPQPLVSVLTGLPTEASLAERPISAVIIENQTDARPQSGLSQAGVVYEALAEGGITRFEAFYQDLKPSVLGPVRSLRTYFVDWGLEYDAPVAHAGGNADALDLVAPLGLKDLNALTGAYSSFYRTKDRVAPHNLYTTGDLLDALLLANKFNVRPTLKPSPRTTGSPAGTPTHPTIHIDYSYTGYQVDYKYDAAATNYVRYLAGTPHIDRVTGQPIHVKNIVVEYMPTSYGKTRTNEDTVIMQTVGQGKTVVFRDGIAIEGTWSKASHAGRTILTDASGAEIPLDPGNTWYSIVPVGKSVTY